MTRAKEDIVLELSDIVDQISTIAGGIITGDTGDK